MIIIKNSNIAKNEKNLYENQVYNLEINLEKFEIEIFENCFFYFEVKTNLETKLTEKNFFEKKNQKTIFKINKKLNIKFRYNKKTKNKFEIKIFFLKNDRKNLLKKIWFHVEDFETNIYKTKFLNNFFPKSNSKFFFNYFFYRNNDSNYLQKKEKNNNYGKVKNISLSKLSNKYDISENEKIKKISINSKNSKTIRISINSKNEEFGNSPNSQKNYFFQNQKNFINSKKFQNLYTKNKKRNIKKINFSETSEDLNFSNYDKKFVLENSNMDNRLKERIKEEFKEDKILKISGNLKNRKPLNLKMKNFNIINSAHSDIEKNIGIKKREKRGSNFSTFKIVTIDNKKNFDFSDFEKNLKNSQTSDFGKNLVFDNFYEKTKITEFKEYDKNQIYNKNKKIDLKTFEKNYRSIDFQNLKNKKVNKLEKYMRKNSLENQNSFYLKSSLEKKIEKKKIENKIEKNSEKNLKKKKNNFFEKHLEEKIDNFCEDINKFGKSIKKNEKKINKLEKFIEKEDINLINKKNINFVEIDSDFLISRIKAKKDKLKKKEKKKNNQSKHLEKIELKNNFNFEKMEIIKDVKKSQNFEIQKKIENEKIKNLEIEKKLKIQKNLEIKKNNEIQKEKRIMKLLEEKNLKQKEMLKIMR